MSTVGYRARVPQRQGLPHEIEREWQSLLSMAFPSTSTGVWVETGHWCSASECNDDNEATATREVKRHWEMDPRWSAAETWVAPWLDEGVLMCSTVSPLRRLRASPKEGILLIVGATDVLHRHLAGNLRLRPCS